MSYPKELNFHYGKSIKIIGGVDLNPDKHITEYNKRYLDRSPENKLKNPQIYLNALAARKYHRYMNMVHGGDPRFDKSPSLLKQVKQQNTPIEVADYKESAIPVNDHNLSLPRDLIYSHIKDISSQSPHKLVATGVESPKVDDYVSIGL
jgi:hypothetical protein